MKKTKEEIRTKWIRHTPLLPLDECVDNAMQEYAIEHLNQKVEKLIDKDIFDQATLAMEEHYGNGCKTEIDSYFRGAKWMQKQFNK